MRLYNNNLTIEYPNLGKLLKKQYLGGNALLQKDYGKANDCTLTSLAFIYGVDKYKQIENIALKYGYNGDKDGTNPLFIKAIMKKCNTLFNVNKVCYSAYSKGLCYNYQKIKNIIDKGNYILLNMWNDGRNYYHNHTVTIVGYIEYTNGKFLQVYDNWNKTVSYIDYNKLSIISSINWME